MGAAQSAGDFFGSIKDGFVGLGNDIQHGAEDALKFLGMVLVILYARTCP